MTEEDLRILQGQAEEVLAEELKTVTRGELIENAEKDITELITLMRRKNQGYGTADDGFHNFRETARRTICNQPSFEDMLKILIILMDKHWVALCQCGLSDPVAEERFGDLIVYSLIARQMIREARRQGEIA